MGQEDIIGFLKRDRMGWYNSRQIASALRVSVSSVNCCLSRMRKHSEVKERVLPLVQRSGMGRYARGVSFYSFKKL